MIFVRNCGHSDDANRKTKRPETCAAQCVQPAEPYIDPQALKRLNRNAASHVRLNELWAKARKAARDKIASLRSHKKQGEQHET
jgi:hypothetical protein